MYVRKSGLNEEITRPPNIKNNTCSAFGQLRASSYVAADQVCPDGATEEAECFENDRLYSAARINQSYSTFRSCSAVRLFGCSLCNFETK